MNPLPKLTHEQIAQANLLRRHISGQLATVAAVNRNLAEVEAAAQAERVLLGDACRSLQEIQGAAALDGFLQSAIGQRGYGVNVATIRRWMRKPRQPALSQPNALEKGPSI